MTTYSPKKDPLATPRQIKLATNSEATERWQRKLFRAASELKKLAAERKRLLNPRAPGGKVKHYEITGMGGGAVEGGLNDDLPF